MEGQAVVTTVGASVSLSSHLSETFPQDFAWSWVHLGASLQISTLAISQVGTEELEKMDATLLGKPELSSKTGIVRTVEVFKGQL